MFLGYETGQLGPPEALQPVALIEKLFCLFAGERGERKSPRQGEGVRSRSGEKRAEGQRADTLHCGLFWSWRWYKTHTHCWTETHLLYPTLIFLRGSTHNLSFISHTHTHTIRHLHDWLSPIEEEKKRRPKSKSAPVIQSYHSFHLQSWELLVTRTN